MSSSKNILYCSFCGKSQHEVRKLIAGPTVFICDECVELCMDIIKEENKDTFVKHQDGLPSPKQICSVLDSRIDSDRSQCSHSIESDVLVFEFELYANWDIDLSVLSEGEIKVRIKFKI